MRRTPRRPRGVARSAAASIAALLLIAGIGAWGAASPAEAAGEFRRIADLVAAAGEDPRAGYGRIRIPSLGVDAPLSERDVALGDARMPNPYGPADVAWYDFESLWYGGDPGAGRNAIFSGHVDYNAHVSYAGARYRGEGVFARLGELQPGDVVEVVRDGKTYRYAVSWKQLLPGDPSERWDRVLSSSVPVDSITLYTCDGAFSGATLSYSHRLVVRAERLEGTPRRLPAPVHGVTYGRGGTTHPVALAQAQRFEVGALFMRHPTTGEWLTYRPGAPSFVNTMLGYLRPETLVIALAAGHSAP